MHKKRVAAAILILLFMFSAFVGLESTKMTKANFTPLPTLPTPVYIRSDGSVEPSTAPLQRVADTYKLTNNLNNTIEVQLSNIAVDGNGFVITKPAVNTQGLMMPVGWLPGVNVCNLNNVTITNVVFENCITGVKVNNSSTITISQNVMHGTWEGIVVMSSSDVRIIGNNISLPNQSFATGMSFLPTNPNASNPYNIRLERNLIVGILSQAPLLPRQPEQYGIWGGFSNSQMIANNIKRIEGIGLYYSGSNNLIEGNNFQESYKGIHFNSQSSVNSTFFRNNFINNSENAVVPYIRNSPFNFWDNGTVGNYWSDYSGTDLNRDSIGDSPHILQTVYYDYELDKNVTVEEGRDNFPLMTPIGIENITFEMYQPPNSTSSLLTSPSSTPSPSLTPTLSASPIQSTPPSPSPTQQPAPTEVIPFVDPPDPTRSYIFYSIIILATLLAVGFTIYFAKRRRVKQ